MAWPSDVRLASHNARMGLMCDYTQYQLERECDRNALIDRQRKIIHDLQGRIHMLEGRPNKVNFVLRTPSASRAPGRMPAHFTSTDASKPLGPPHPRHPPLTRPHWSLLGRSVTPVGTLRDSYVAVSEPRQLPQDGGPRAGGNIEAHAELVAASMARVYRGPHETWQKPENLVDLVAEATTSKSNLNLHPPLWSIRLRLMQQSITNPMTRCGAHGTRAGAPSPPNTPAPHLGTPNQHPSLVREMELRSRREAPRLVQLGPREGGLREMDVHLAKHDVSLKTTCWSLRHGRMGHASRHLVVTTRARCPPRS